MGKQKWENSGLTYKRLICPYCDAQYDVADDAIPESGRVVQCSNCNQIWFYLGTKSEPAPTTDTLEPVSQTESEPLDTVKNAIIPEDATHEQQLGVPDLKVPRLTREDTTPKPAVDAAQTRRRIAELTEARAARRKLVTALRAATARGAAKRPKLMPAKYLNRVTQPSIDTDTYTPDMPSMNDETTSLRAFVQAPEPKLINAELAAAITRRGFVSVLLIFPVLFRPYIFADNIMAYIPRSSDTIAGYVGMIDGWRLMLNQTAGALGDMIADVPAGQDTQRPHALLIHLRDLDI